MRYLKFSSSKDQKQFSASLRVKAPGGIVGGLRLWTEGGVKFARKLDGIIVPVADPEFS